MTFSLDASRTSACLITDSAADSDRTGVTHSVSKPAPGQKAEAMGLLLPADSMLTVGRALGGSGAGLDAARDSRLLTPGQGLSPRPGYDPKAGSAQDVADPVAAGVGWEASGMGLGRDVAGLRAGAVRSN